MFTPLITHDSDGAALAAPVNTARCNGAAYKTRTIDDLRIKDERLRGHHRGHGHLLFDGGMGTMLQAAGMKAGALPELLNFEEPQVITDIQRQYAEAGCDVITANTFGANAHKLDGTATVADVFAGGRHLRPRGRRPLRRRRYRPHRRAVAPLGTSALTRPTTSLSRKCALASLRASTSLLSRLMTDLVEIKAAVLACRENSDLPVFATMTFEEDGRTFPGNEPRSRRHHARRHRRRCPGHQLQSGPGGAPRTRCAHAHRYRQSPSWCRPTQDCPAWTTTATPSLMSKAPEYAEAVAGMTEDGVSVVGGCCGTTPAHMAALRTLIDNHTPSPASPQAQHCRSRAPRPWWTFPATATRSLSSSAAHQPQTGKKRLQQALRDGDLD